MLATFVSGKGGVVDVGFNNVFDFNPAAVRRRGKSWRKQGAGFFVAAANPAAMSHTKKMSAPCIFPTLILTLILTY
jgi:hypothetical protein